MTKEEVEQVRREKKMDDDTRKQLEQLYGPSRASQRQRIHLTRLEKQRQVCPHCKRKSADARRVCEFCLQPEAGTLTNEVMRNAAAGVGGGGSGIGAAAQPSRPLPITSSAPRPQPAVSQMRLLVSSHVDPSSRSAPAAAVAPLLQPAPGGGAMRLTLPHTQRCYRIVTADVLDEGGYYRAAAGSAAKGTTNAPAPVARGMRGAMAEEEDEPDGGIQDRGYGGVDEDETEEKDHDNDEDEIEQNSGLRQNGNTKPVQDAPPARDGDRVVAHPPISGSVVAPPPPPPPSSSSSSSVHHPAAVPFAPFAVSTALGKAAAAPPGQLPRRNPNKADFTHFIAIPIGLLPEVKDSLATMVECMQSISTASSGESEQRGGLSPRNGNASGPITRELFNTVERMHLTLLMLSLHTREDVELAKDLLKAFGEAWMAEKKRLWQSDERFRQQCRTKGNAAPSSSSSLSLVNPTAVRPLIRLGGLYVMPSRQQQDQYKRLQAKMGKSSGANSDSSLPYQELQKGVDLSSAGVVYMGLDDVDSLCMVRRIQDLLHSVFAELLMDSEEEANSSKELIHMTILNKKWRSGPAKRPFDATELLSIFGQTQLGAGEAEKEKNNATSGCYDGFAIEEVVLCRISSTGTGKRGWHGRGRGRDRDGTNGSAPEEGEEKMAYVREAMVSL